MRPRRIIAFLSALLVMGLLWWQFSQATRRGEQTWLELTEAETGRKLFAGALRSGEEVVLTWKNSLFGLWVTEVFVARSGRLELTTVTFADPQGRSPAAATSEDLDDLYHTGGPFRVEGLQRPLVRAVFRIGEIGDPRLAIGRHTVQLKKEAGFGGAVRLEARKPRLRWGRSPAEMLASMQNRMIAGAF
jgi:hypothetical protein